jgi:hypothetical protein
MFCPVHHRCLCVCVFVCKCRNAGLSGIRSVRYWNEKKKIIDAGTGPVPGQAKAVRHFFWSGTGLKLLMLERRCLR